MSDQTVQAIRERLQSAYQLVKDDTALMFEELQTLLDQFARLTAEGQALREERDQLEKDLNGLLGSTVPDDLQR